MYIQLGRLYVHKLVPEYLLSVALYIATSDCTGCEQCLHFSWIEIKYPTDRHLLINTDIQIGPFSKL